MKVCIIGGGVSGIQTAKLFSENGYECDIFEKATNIGGVWRDNYTGYALQVPSELYEFVDMPLNNQDGTFPSGKQVQNYIESYVKKHGLWSLIHLEEEVRLIDWTDGAWSITTSKGMYTFDYCIVATGMYSNSHIPQDVKDLIDSNGGCVIHSSDFVDAELASNKNVVVIGGGKSAIDCAVAASNHASNVRIASRALHWPVPRYILGVIPFKWGTYSRVGHFLLPKHWCMTDREHKVHDWLRPIKGIVWRTLECIFAFQFKLKKTPETPLDVDLFNGGQILNYEFRDLLRNHKIQQIVLSHNKLDFEATLQSADLVICGTGFQKNYGVFSETVREKLIVESDGMWLYKNILPINLDNIAFIGSEVSTFNNILTQNLQIQWLLYMIKEKQLPSKAFMKDYVEQEKAWKRSWMPFSASRSSLVQLHMTKYHDILLGDCNRKLVKTRWWEWFLPLTARDYS